MKYGILVGDLTLDEARGMLDNLFYCSSTATATLVAPTADDEGVAATGTHDSSGLPWDERIHASTKTINKDGTWKKRKGVQQVDVDAVEAELRASSVPVAVSDLVPVTGNIAGTLPPIPEGYAALPHPSGTAVLPPGAAPVAQPVAPAPLPPPPAAPVPQPTINRDFQGLMQHISLLYRHEKLTDSHYPNAKIIPRINQAFQSQVETITDIAGNDNMVEYAWQCLEVDGLGSI